MAASCRFAFAIHVLAVLARKHSAGGACSDLLARSVNTNPVVIRRLLAQLRTAGLVQTTKGVHGGAALCEPPQNIALDTVYRAVQPLAPFGKHRQKPNARCPVGAGIERVLDEIFTASQAALESELARRTLGDVLQAMDAAAPAAPAARLAAAPARREAA